MRKRRFHIMYLSAAPFFVSFFFLMLLISGSAVRAGIGMEAGSESTQLTLRDALIIALENNLDIKVNFIEQEKSMADINASKGEFDPVISLFTPLSKETQGTVSFLEAAGNQSLTRKSFDFSSNFSKKFSTGGYFEFDYSTVRLESNSIFSTVNPSFYSSATMSIRQPLLKDFGMDINRRNIIIAQNNTEYSRYEFEDRVVNILNNVQKQYWDLVYAKENLKAVQEALNLAQEQLRRNEIQVKVGTLAPIEISQSKYAVAQREEDIIRAEAALRNAEDYLKVALNMTGKTAQWEMRIDPVTEPAVPGDLDIDVDELIITALQNRPDYQQQKIDIMNKSVLKQYTHNQTLPSLELRASYGLTGVGGNVYSSDDPLGGGERVLLSEGGFIDSLDQLASGNFENWQIALNVSYTLFNRAAEANRVQAELNLKQSRLQLERLKQQIVLEVREAARMVDTNRKGFEKAMQARMLAEEQLDAEQKKFEVGTSTNFQVLEYQKELTDSITNEVMAKIEFNKSKHDFEKAVGIFLDSWDIQIK